MNNSANNSFSQLWSRSFKGCLIAAIIIFLGSIWLFIYVLKIPTIERIGDCREKLLTAGRAIELYRSKHKEYPDSIEDLKDEFLKDENIIGCEDGDGKWAKFIYNKPEYDSPDDFIILERDMGVNSKGIKIGKMVYFKKGTVSMQPSDDKFK